MNRYYIVFAVILLYLNNNIMAQQFISVKDATGIEIGSIAPDFSATDQNDSTFNLYEALEHNAIVLIFFRGHWCPFCNKHLKALQDSLSQIESLGARVIALSPENSDFIKKTMDKTHASFTLLYDEGYKIAEAYGVNFRPDSISRFMYNTVMGAKLKQSHSDDSEQLPIPATYIISKDKMVKWRHFDPDYKKRSKVSDILANL